MQTLKRKINTRAMWIESIYMWYFSWGTHNTHKNPRAQKLFKFQGKKYIASRQRRRRSRIRSKFSCQVHSNMTIEYIKSHNEFVRIFFFLVDDGFQLRLVGTLPTTNYDSTRRKSVSAEYLRHEEKKTFSISFHFRFVLIALRVCLRASIRKEGRKRMDNHMKKGRKMVFNKPQNSWAKV